MVPSVKFGIQNEMGTISIMQNDEVFGISVILLAHEFIKILQSEKCILIVEDVLVEVEDMKFYGEEQCGKQYWGYAICGLSSCGLCTEDPFIINHDGDFYFSDPIILMKDGWEILRRHRKKITPYFTESCHMI